MRKAGSTWIREHFPSKQKTVYSHSDGPLFTTIRHPFSRLVSGYRTVQARAIASLLKRKKFLNTQKFFAYLDSIQVLVPGAATTSKEQKDTLLRGLPIQQLPFFRVRKELDRFIQFVQDLKDFGTFSRYVLTQSYDIFSFTASGEPVAPSFLSAANALLMALLNSFRRKLSPHFRKYGKAQGWRTTLHNMIPIQTLNLIQ